MTRLIWDRMTMPVDISSWIARRRAELRLVLHGSLHSLNLLANEAPERFAVRHKLQQSIDGITNGQSVRCPTDEKITQMESVG
jgi:hypothetical protein